MVTELAGGEFILFLKNVKMRIVNNLFAFFNIKIVFEILIYN